MTQTIRLWLVLLLPTLILAGANSADAQPSTTKGKELTEERVLAEDDFSAPRLSSHWTWLREDKEGRRLQDGKLSIRTRGQLWGKENLQRNVLLHKSFKAGAGSSTTALAAELTVDAGLRLTHRYEHGGLIWYFDDDNWVTLTQLNHVQDGTQKIMLVHEVAGQGQAQTAKDVPYTDAQVQLRLEARGASFTGYFRRPGSSQWQKVGSLEFTHSGPEPRFGVVAGQGDDDQLHWVDFDDFRVLALP